MKRKYFLTLLALIIICFTQITYGQSDQKKEKPNIVLIMADDMGYETVGAYGSEIYETPNLDKMAENGVKFTNMFSQPLCTPSRVKIMTGMHNYRNYTSFGYLNPEEVTFSNILQDVGYHTLIAGKWQLNGFYMDKEKGWEDEMRPFHFGFDEFILWQVTKEKSFGERYADPLISLNGKEMPRDENAYGPDVFTNYILDFIERKKDEPEPFLVYYPMVLPHNPFVPTPDSPEWSNPDQRYEDKDEYFDDMISYVDKLVGKINDYLEENGLAENTLVLFTGDNGTNTRIHSEMETGLIVEGRKGQLDEWGIRVPMLAYWKGKSLEGAVNEDILDFSDFLPTLLDAADIPTPANKVVDGQSFLPQIVGEPTFKKEYVYMYYKPNWFNQPKGVFARTEKYKLYGDGRFFNVEEDVKEENPIADDEMTQEEVSIRKKLQNVLDQKPNIPGESSDTMNLGNQ